MTPWLVHAFTATGALLAYLALEAGIAGDARAALLWLVAATAIDAVDGVFARLARVKERTPLFDGALLDNIIDYLTFVFVPVVLLRHSALLPDGPAGLAVAAAVLLSSAYGFCRLDAKTADHFFTGFPSYWNIVAAYMIAFRLRPGGERGVAMGVRGAGLRADRLCLPVAHRALAGTDGGAGRPVGVRDDRDHLAVAVAAAMAGLGVAGVSRVLRRDLAAAARAAQAARRLMAGRARQSTSGASAPHVSGSCSSSVSK